MKGSWGIVVSFLIACVSVVGEVEAASLRMVYTADVRGTLGVCG